MHVGKFVMQVKKRVPDVHVIGSFPNDPTKLHWLDFELGSIVVCVEYPLGAGYGVSRMDSGWEDNEIGCAPDEIIPDEDTAAERVASILLTGK